MFLSAVSKAAVGALRVTKPLLQNEVAKVSGALAVNSEYASGDLTSPRGRRKSSALETPCRRIVHRPLPPPFRPDESVPFEESDDLTLRILAAANVVELCADFSKQVSHSLMII